MFMHISWFRFTSSWLNKCRNKFASKLKNSAKYRAIHLSTSSINRSLYGVISTMRIKSLLTGWSEYILRRSYRVKISCSNFSTELVRLKPGYISDFQGLVFSANYCFEITNQVFRKYMYKLLFGVMKSNT